MCELGNGKSIDVAAKYMADAVASAFNNDRVKEVRVKFKNGDHISIKTDCKLCECKILFGDAVTIKGYDDCGNFAYISFQTCDVLYIAEVR